METAQTFAFTASLLLIGIFLTTGCGSVSGGSAATASTTTTATTTTTSPTAATAQLAVNFTSLNFGNVPLDTTSAPQSVTLSNSGTSSVTISSISTSTSAFNASGVPAGLAVNPGQTVPLNVTFTPSGPGPETGNISVGTEVASVSITVSGTSHEVMLSWTASTSTTPAVTGYNVYRATTPGAFTKPLNSSPLPASTTQFTDTSVQSGQTYYYVVTAVNSLALESDPSNQALGSVPTPS
jgi:hypothetical protein